MMFLSLAMMIIFMEVTMIVLTKTETKDQLILALVWFYISSYLLLTIYRLAPIQVYPKVSSTNAYIHDVIDVIDIVILAPILTVVIILISCYLTSFHVCQSVCLSVRLSVTLCVRPSVYLSIYLSIYLFIYFSFLFFWISLTSILHIPSLQ